MEKESSEEKDNHRYLIIIFIIGVLISLGVFPWFILKACETGSRLCIFFASLSGLLFLIFIFLLILTCRWEKTEKGEGESKTGAEGKEP